MVITKYLSLRDSITQNHFKDIHTYTALYAYIHCYTVKVSEGKLLRMEFNSLKKFPQKTAIWCVHIVTSNMLDLVLTMLAMFNNI